MLTNRRSHYIVEEIWTRIRIQEDFIFLGFCSRIIKIYENNRITETMDALALQPSTLGVG